VVAIFAIWDAYAIASGHWTFGSSYVTGIEVGFNIPLEEICFFIAIPICAILTLEGVRASSKMLAGDESGKG
jgi:lycopene cyclase domain-containing protein